jgi:hypothetical protein
MESGYIEALHRIRLREAFTIITKEKTQILQENRRLKELLELYGIPYNPDQLGEPTANLHQNPSQLSGTSLPTPPPRSYDEIGVDFVLASVNPLNAPGRVIADRCF